MFFCWSINKSVTVFSRLISNSDQCSWTICSVDIQLYFAGQHGIVANISKTLSLFKSRSSNRGSKAQPLYTLFKTEKKLVHSLKPISIGHLLTNLREICGLRSTWSFGDEQVSFMENELREWSMSACRRDELRPASQPGRTGWTVVREGTTEDTHLSLRLV